MTVNLYQLALENASASHVQEGMRSPLDRPISVTVFRDHYAASKRDLIISLRELADRIGRIKRGKKGELPDIQLARYGDLATEAGSLRSNANVRWSSGIQIDHDSGNLRPRDAVRRLKEAGLAALVVTSASHSIETPKWHAFLPASFDMNEPERIECVERVNAIFDGDIDQVAFTLSQPCYCGTVDGGEPVDTRLVDGSYIDERPDLPRMPKIGRNKPDNDNKEWREHDFSGWPADRVSSLLDELADLDERLPDDPKRRFWTARHDGVRAVGFALHHWSGGSAEGKRIFKEWYRRDPANPWHDKWRQWSSFRDATDRPITLATLIDAARGDWALSRTEAGFYLDPIDDDDLPSLPKPKSSPLSFLTPSDCEVAETRGYVVKGFVAPGDIGCIFGAPGVGKSLIAPHVAYAVAQARSVFGMRAKGGKVFYVAAEDETGMRGRVRALKERWDDAPDFRLVGGCSDLMTKDSADLKALVAAVEEHGPALIVIDTLAIAFPGLEENDAASMSRVVTVARKLAAYGAAVILVHHDTKEGGSTPRGHSVLNGALDMALHLTRGEDGIVRGQLTKNRNGSCDRDIAFKIATRAFGEDEDGDPITAALVDELEGDQRPKLRLSKSAKAALAILESLGGASGGKEWINACVAGRDISASENRDSRRRTTSRAIKELADARIVHFFDDAYHMPVPELDWGDDEEDADLV